MRGPTGMTSFRVAEVVKGLRLRAQRWVLTGATVWLAGGCGHEQLVSAASAHVVPGAPTAAFDEQEGVRVSVNSDAWRGPPDDLAKRLTPLKVRLINHSGKPVQILYERFTLRGASGLDLPALTGRAPGPRRRTCDASPADLRERELLRGPSLPRCLSVARLWSQALQRDETFYQRQYQLWGDGPPTTQMQRSALPEGVLGDDGEMSGYLYFENATRGEDRLKFKAELDEGHGGYNVATIELPFRVE